MKIADGFGNDLPNEAVLDATDKPDADKHAGVVNVLGDGELGEGGIGGKEGVEVAKIPIFQIIEKRLVIRITNDIGTDIV